MLHTSESTVINPERLGHSFKNQKQSNKYYIIELSLTSCLIGTEHVQLSSSAVVISSSKKKTRLIQNITDQDSQAVFDLLPSNVPCFHSVFMMV